jgi:hypothetical protein
MVSDPLSEADAADMLKMGTKKGTSGWVVSAGREKLRKAVEELWNGIGGGDTRGVSGMPRSRVAD